MAFLIGNFSCLRNNVTELDSRKFRAETKNCLKLPRVHVRLFCNANEVSNL